MKKIIMLFLQLPFNKGVKIVALTVCLFLGHPAVHYAQNCLPDGILLMSQAAVDSFPLNYPECKTVDGRVRIKGPDIVNLWGLSQIERINGGLYLSSADNLKDFSGLHNLKFSKFLNVSFCEKLVSFHGLANLDTISDNLYVYGVPQLKDFSGFVDLKYIGQDLEIVNCASLRDFVGLENLVRVGAIRLYDCPQIIGLDGLNGVQMVMERIYLQNCNRLKNLTGLSRVKSIGSLYMYNLDSLLNFQGVDSLHSISKNLTIGNCKNLTGFSGLERLDSIGHDFDISNCVKLKSFLGLSSLKYIGRDFKIYNLDEIENLSGLTGLSRVDNDFKISVAGKLKSLDGLGNLVIGRDFCLSYLKELQSQLSSTGLLSIGRDFVIEMISYTDVFNGPQGVVSVGRHMYIRQNNFLAINWPHSPKRIEGALEISSNNYMHGFWGFDSTTYIGGGINFISNGKMRTFRGFRNLDYLKGSLVFTDNFKFETLSGFDSLRLLESGNISFDSATLPNLKKISGFYSLENMVMGNQGGTGNLKINSNTIDTIIGFDKLGYVNGNIDVVGSNIRYFIGFPNLKTLYGSMRLNLPKTGRFTFPLINAIGGNLTLIDCDSLHNLNCFDHLKKVEGKISIIGNNLLTDILGLRNLSSESFNHVVIKYNPMLTSCAVKGLCNYLEYHLTTADIMNNAPGCNNHSEILSECNYNSIEENTPRSVPLIFPNPAGESVSVIIPGPSISGENFIQLLDFSGREVYRSSFQGNHIMIDCLPFAGGVYIYRLFVNNQGFSGKIMVSHQTR